MARWIRIEDIFDIPLWEELQDAIASSTNMALITTNYRGEPITKHSNRSDFCSHIREDPKLRKYCQKCDARGGFEAMNNGKPFIYLCYFSIVDMAIPIVIYEHYVGAIFAGQVRLSPKSENRLEKIFHPIDNHLIDEIKQSFQADYNKLPFMEYKEIEKVSALISAFSSYLCSDAIKASTNNSSKSTLVQNNDYQAVPYELYQDIYSFFKEQDFATFHPSVQRCIRYLFNNKEKRPTLRDMANYCNITAGYLSNLFVRDTNYTYTQALSVFKTEWGKGMLENSDKSVAEIAESLGYEETSYYIRLFKKYVGATPALYRRSIVGNAKKTDLLCVKKT